MRQVICFLLILISYTTYGQSKMDSLKCIPLKDSLLNLEYFLMADILPEYPGGYEKMNQFFFSNYNQPTGECQIAGSVFISCIIDTLGKMTNFKIIRSYDYQVDNEIIRILKLMPKWEPAKCGNKPVNFKITLPWRIHLY